MRSSQKATVAAISALSALFVWGTGIAAQMRGTEVDRSSAEDAAAIRRDAERGDPKSETKLGNLYFHGMGVQQSYSDALNWYRKAAESGDADAQCDLGSMYFNGYGVPINQTAAANWYRLAANQGLAKAEYDLGYLYNRGQGVPMDSGEAIQWYQKAANQGNETAQRALGLRSGGLSGWRLTTLIAIVLWSLWLLKSALRAGGGNRTRAKLDRTLILSGSSGLAYVGVALYRTFGIFQSAITADSLRFIEGIFLGVMVAMAVFASTRKGAGVMFGIAGVLFVGINVPLIAHRDLNPLSDAFRGLCAVDGFLLAASIYLAITLWLGHNRSTNTIDPVLKIGR